MKIAIFGGSFDPLHSGHTQIVDVVLKSLPITKLIILPAFLSPFKQKYMLSSRVRLLSVKREFHKKNKVIISNYELTKNQKSSTYQSVLHLQKKYSPTKIYLVIGADNAPSLHKWGEFIKLKSKVTFCIIARDKINIKKTLQKKIKFHTINIRNRNSSSTIKQDGNQKPIPIRARRYYKQQEQTNQHSTSNHANTSR